MKSYIKCDEVYIIEKHSDGSVSYTTIKPEDPTKIVETRKEYYFMRPTQPICLELGHETQEYADGEIVMDIYSNQYTFMPFDVNSPISSEDLKMITNKIDELNIGK